MLFPTYSSVPFVKVLHIFQLCFVNIFLELLKTKQQQTSQQVVNGRLINYNVMYATVRCDKKMERNRHATRTSHSAYGSRRNENKFLPWFLPNVSRRKGCWGYKRDLESCLWQMSDSSSFPQGGGGGYSSEFLMGVCRLVLHFLKGRYRFLLLRFYLID